MTARITILPSLPSNLEPLATLARSIATTWDDGALALFAEVAPDAHGASPIARLVAAEPARLAALAADGSYVERLAAAVARQEARRSGASWYDTLGDRRPTSIAYFSPEYGVSDVLPQYSGGLGVLAGDHLKAASDLGVPIVAVGLFYRSGYFQQVLTASGEQREEFVDLDPSALPMALVSDEQGVPVEIAVPLPGALLRARIWRVDVGRVPLLLLDADLPANAEAERAVTDRLYGGDREHRLRQELLLGVGGVRALAACGFTPDVFHMNEGHAGFSAFERTRALVDEHGLEPATALEVVRAGTVFTTHTPVPAGIDRFPRELVARYFGPSGVPSGLPLDLLCDLGVEPGGDSAVFNMAVMGIRLASRVNGVSALHGVVARTLFHDLFPGLPEADVPIGHVTNGVHADTWVSPDFAALYRSRLGDGYGDQTHGFASLAELSDDELAAARSASRRRLVDEVRFRIRRTWAGRGLRGGQLVFADRALDPDALTIGFARRVPTYKRLTLMLRDPERLTRLLLDDARPVQLLIAGKAHPQDAEGKALIAELGAFAARPELRHRIVMLSDYDMALARVLVAGVDVWLNNPLRPFEACGTSGMKAALNGGLNLSILDGWWDECYDGSNGWAIPSADDGTVDPTRRDDFEADALLGLLERDVVPRFYDDRPAWLAMVRSTVSTLAPQLLATRMVRDYVNDLYVPAANDATAVVVDGFAAARRRAAVRARVRGAWSEVAIEGFDAHLEGGELRVAATVRLGSLAPGDVAVSAIARRSGGESLTIALAPDQPNRFTGSALAAAGSWSIVVQVLPAATEFSDGRVLGCAVTSA